MKDEPEIRYGRDSYSGVVVDIQAGPLHQDKNYDCLECDEKLELVQGSSKIRHFRHYGYKDRMGDSRGNSRRHLTCSMYYSGDQKAIRESFRTSVIEKAEKDKNIRLVITPEPFTDRYLGLYGILPILNHTTLEGNSIDNVLSTIRFKHQGFLEEPIASRFHSSESRALLKLNPDFNSQYMINIETQSNSTNLSGDWSTEPLQDKDIFYGTPNEAERIDKNNVNNINEGTTVFIIFALLPENLPEGIRKFKLGNWNVISFEVTEEFKEFFEKHVESKWHKEHTFHADIILPDYVDPRSTMPIIERPGTDVLIGLIPPKGQDPEFEVVPIPLENEGFRTLKKKGTNVPRFLTTKFPEEGSVRISLNLTNRQRAIQIHTGATDYFPHQTLDEKLSIEPMTNFEIKNNGSIQSSEPLWELGNLKIIKNDEARTLKELGLIIKMPEGLRFDLDCHYLLEEKTASTVTVYGTSLEEVDEGLFYWLKEGLTGLIFHLGPLGTIKVDFYNLNPWQKRYDKEKGIEELKELIRNYGKSPRKKVKLKFVRELLGVPDGIPSKEIRGGIKAKVRKAVMELRKDGN